MTAARSTAPSASWRLPSAMAKCFLRMAVLRLGKPSHRLQKVDLDARVAWSRSSGSRMPAPWMAFANARAATYTSSLLKRELVVLAHRPGIDARRSSVALLCAPAWVGCAADASSLRPTGRRRGRATTTHDEDEGRR
jgi:hypothetical protein